MICDYLDAAQSDAVNGAGEADRRGDQAGPRLLWECA